MRYIAPDTNVTSYISGYGEKKGAKADSYLRYIPFLLVKKKGESGQ